MSRLFLRYWPWLAALLLAAALFWLRPARELSALLITLSYLAWCGLIWQRHRRAQQPAAQAGTLPVAYASQSGQARELAERSAQQLSAAGVAAQAVALNQLTLDPSPTRLLLVASTYGEGEAPDNGARFERQLLDATLDLRALEYAVLALGDSGYQHFCAFGQRLDRLLQGRGATRLFDRLEVDRQDPGTLRHWQQQLGQLSGQHQFSDWQPAAYQAWQLAARHCLNSQSTAAPVFELSLSGPPPAPTWQAGDLVEVGPRHPSALLFPLLQQLRLDPQQRLADGPTLLEACAERQLPDPQRLQGLSAEALVAHLPLLAHREYSIASVPADGPLQLLVRQMYHPDGHLGLGSGWLCQHAEPGQSIALRIRRNPSFHGPAAEVPLILIGSGTGLAGLRAHLRERPRGSRNWLLFGERHRAQDFFCQSELLGWQQSGHLERLDLAFSRDQADKIYVQHLLRDAADDLRHWLAQGAAIYVCGSLQGMGREVHQLLLGLLGPAELEQLSEQGRYQRDLY